MYVRPVNEEILQTIIKFKNTLSIEELIFKYYSIIATIISKKIHFNHTLFDSFTYRFFSCCEQFIKNKTFSYLNKKIRNLDVSKKEIIIDNPLNNVLNECYYINLEKDKKRKKRIESYNFNLKTTRFNAIRDSYGHIGCTKSHINLLELLYSKNETNNTYYMIVEDDIFISDQIKYNEYMKSVNNLIKRKNVDVILLCGSFKIINIDENYGDNFFKCMRTNTTTGYIIKRSFIPELLKKFKESLHYLSFIPKLKKQKI